MVGAQIGALYSVGLDLSASVVSCPGSFEHDALLSFMKNIGQMTSNHIEQLIAMESAEARM